MPSSMRYSNASRRRRLYRPGLSILAASLGIGFSACADNVSVVVAPNLGKTAECLEWMPMPEDARLWLTTAPIPAPPGWYAWEDWLADRVKPKLISDCE